MTPEIIRYRIAPERQAAFEQAYAAAPVSLQHFDHSFANGWCDR